MKIGHPADPAAAAAAALAQSRVATTDASKAAGPIATPTPMPKAAVEPEAGTQIALSSTAATLRSGTADAAGDFDAAKVSRISQAIADGSFKVNPEAIADKLIANAQELLSKTTR